MPTSAQETIAAGRTPFEPVPPEAEKTLYEQGAPAQEAPPPAEPLAAEPIPPEAESELLTGAAPAAKPDDLTVIEGIGPKISAVLQAAGITSYSQLAQTDQERLEVILKNANLRLANPGTWVEQARLAAAGDWDGLAELQNRLKGGRRT
jgi:predicted flap endonuclease-1-like 5' DNA nuclease